MKFLTLFTLMSLVLFSSIQAKEENVGTAIVTYKTGPEAKRLKRVRFRLIYPDQNQQMFPKKDVYVDDKNQLTRMVVIDDLAPGKYTIEFLVPNIDGLFTPVPARDFTVTAGKVVKIDQMIHPCYSTIEAAISFDPQLDQKQSLPLIILKDQSGQLFAQSPSGNLSATDLLAGSYILSFEEFTGYKTPDPIVIALKPDQTAGPFTGTYIAADEPQEPGTLVVSFDTGPEARFLDLIRFKITNSQGKTRTYPQQGTAVKDPATEGYTVTVAGLPPGEYSIHFFMHTSSDNIQDLRQSTFSINAEETTSLQESFKANF